MSSAAVPTAGPLLPGDRIAAIDVVRGLAVLGILVMNIVEFGWPAEAYGNPAWAGGSSGLDLAAWYVQVTLFDGRMRALFSLLFGVGIVLFAERLVRSDDAPRTTDLLLRRCLWLVPFGIVHRFFLQFTGDILYQYGLLGFVAVVFRHLGARTLVVLGCIWLCAFVPISWRKYSLQADTRAQAAEAARLQQAGETVPEALAAAQRRWQQRETAIPPKPEVVAKKVDEVRVGYWQLFRNRWDYHHGFQSSFLYYYWVFDVLGLMLIGMGLGKAGFFHGRWRTRSYVGCVALGLATAAATAWWAHDWQAAGFAETALELRLVHDLTYAPARLLGALGWAAALLLVLRAGRARLLTAALGAVGRMAFSCYILQSVVAGALFYGFGCGWFGLLRRSELMLVWLGISLLQVAVAVLWLRRWRSGPLEWVWRALTWWRWRPMRAAGA